jgi:hypothetical protein
VEEWILSRRYGLCICGKGAPPRQCPYRDITDALALEVRGENERAPDTERGAIARDGVDHFALAGNPAHIRR